MMKCLTAAVAVFVAVFAAAPVMAADNFGARLRGFEETPVPISTVGQGFLFATLNDAGTELTYSLVYFGTETNVTQAHIHFGQPGVSGGIVLFFCTNLAPPAGVPVPPACPNGPGINQVTGTLTAANVIAQAAQGIASGDFTEVTNAMKAGISYANVHTIGFPSGEVRGHISR